MKKILIVDDHPIVQKGISSMLADKPYTVLDATTPEQAIMIHKHISNISLMVCGLSLPTTTEGIKLIEHIRSIRPHIPIIVFTMHNEPWNIKTLIDIDVDGIVLKDESPKELMLAIDCVLNGKKYLSPQSRKMRNEVMTSNTVLSKKEIEIIKEISFGHKNREIAEKYNMCEKTIEYHRSSILRKFGVNTMTEAVRQACEMGLLQ